ncbi:DUF3299 domain-containing protein [Photobacterium sanguinicancri]|uniref:DUF3299 domain-containing protein n=1 Tax=Photobacterium sanguinicancri TaxID=875932 RepID=A0ABX4FVK8_9GAMM|nr:DUF3299 domain-containing protein [Photobacterium sanguinicancri]OZS42899.1 hypothetical protein ASV53_16015 [Photobacterium sanguinicancri]
MLKKLIQFLFVMVLMSASLGSYANDPITIEWQSLRPETAQNPITLPDLSDEERLQLQRVFTLMQSSGQQDTDRIALIKKQLKSKGIDVDELLELRRLYIQAQKKSAEAITTTFDGKNVRIPGFLVPIEFSDAMVTTDFLLVPVAGACIHMPPPPANQIVRISFPEGYKVKNVKYPVWVEGVIASSVKSEDVYIVDGTSNITMGYSLNASKVVDYEEF